MTGLGFFFMVLTLIGCALAIFSLGMMIGIRSGESTGSEANNS